MFEIKLRTDSELDEILNGIKSENLSSRVILFLKNLNELKFYNCLTKEERRIIKKIIEKKRKYEIINIEEYLNNEVQEKSRWVVFKKIVKVPNDVRKDKITIEWERAKIKKREIVVAFRLDDNNNLISTSGTMHIGVFSFLPLKDVESGLNFIVQGDFLTGPGREIIHREAKWNKWILRETFNFIKNEIIPIFQRHRKWKYSFFEVLYPSYGKHELFEIYLKNPLRALLDKEKMILTEKGAWENIENVIVVSKNLNELINTTDIEKVWRKQKVHPKFKMPNLVDVQTLEINNRIVPLLLPLIKEKAKEKNVKWFEKFYLQLADYYSERYLKETVIDYHDVLLTEDFRLVNRLLENVYIKTAKIPSLIKKIKSILFIHPQLTKNKKLREFFKKLGIEELTKDVINNLIKKIKDEKNLVEFSSILERWSTLSDTEKIKKINLLKELWMETNRLPYTKEKITLPSKSGKWLSPSLLVFSEEYAPSHNLEKLMKKGFCDIDWLEFLDTIFIKNANKNEKEKWRSFFEELGVDKVLKDKAKIRQLAERIAILIVQDYEKKSKRFPSVLAESEKVGYDIISSTERGKSRRFIEVKGSTYPEPSLHLTTKEWHSLVKHKEKYYIYFVTDILVAPRINIIKGEKLFRLQEILNYEIPSNRWKNVIKTIKVIRLS